MTSRLNKAINVLAASLLFVLMMLTVVDVIGRTVLNRPLPGTGELTEIALACIVFCLLPQVSLRQRHISVDLISRLVSRPVLMALDVIVALAGFVAFGLVGWRLWYFAVAAGRYDDATPTLGLPLAPLLYLVAVLAGVSAFAFLLTIPEALKGSTSTKTPESPVIA